jgi:uncharacterized membrane protein YhhN
MKSASFLLTVLGALLIAVGGALLLLHDDTEPHVLGISTFFTK